MSTGHHDKHHGVTHGLEPGRVVPEWFRQRLLQWEATVSQNGQFLKRDPCPYCRKKIMNSDGSIEHVVPIGRGGTSHWGNKVWAHRQCNSLRSSSSVVCFLWAIHRAGGSVVNAKTWYRRGFGVRPGYCAPTARIPRAAREERSAPTLRVSILDRGGIRA